MHRKRERQTVFDVRFLPNPYFVETLRHLTGRDEEVKSFLTAVAEWQPFVDRLNGLLDFLIPHYHAEGKSQVNTLIP